MNDDNTRIFHVFEMRIGMNEFDHHILVLLKQQQERPETFRPEQESNPDLCDEVYYLSQVQHALIG